MSTRNVFRIGKNAETHEANALVQQPGLSLNNLKEGFVADYGPNHMPPAAWVAPDPWCGLWTTPKAQVSDPSQTFTASRPTNPVVVRYKGCVYPTREAKEQLEDI